MPFDHTVLVVDDDPQTLASLREALAPHYHLAYGVSGEQALEAAQRVHPSLILLDINLPDMTGIEVCKKLKALPDLQQTPVIFVSSNSEDAFGVDGFTSGGVDYITKPINPELVVARVRTHISLVQAERLEQAHNDAISMLAVAGEYNDSDTGVHIRRMAAISSVVARAAGWSRARVSLIKLAAQMHDIGKLGIPASILKKPGPLDTDEWAIMRKHPEIGHQILAVSEAPVFQLAAEIALAHHERWDGTGYPYGLAAEAIPESAHIVAIADVFDALTSVRPYKKAWSVGETMAHIRESAGSHFNPALVELFEANLAEVVETKAKFDQLAKVS